MPTRKQERGITHETETSERVLSMHDRPTNSQEPKDFLSPVIWNLECNGAMAGSCSSFPLVKCKEFFEMRGSSWRHG